MTKKTNNAKKTKKAKHYRPPGKKIEGNARRYLTRSQAIRQLQVSLPLFRRLCILKGVSPREPKKKVRGNDKTYYHAKDIAFLQHEPLLEKYRDLAAYEKKIKRAEAKKNNERALLLRIRQPSIRLDGLILERYPRFIDALRDLDDCLTMVHLFAVLPAVERFKINVERVHNCRRLSHEWQAYIARTHKLRKVFVSVKGIYYQAEVEGQNITWLTPHSTQQVLPEDVNYSIMLIFLEFYESLLGFVNFRLYHTINVKYPPILDPRLEALAADLYALVRYIDANSRASMLESTASSSSTGEEVDAQLEGQEAEDESKIRLAQLQHQLPSNEPSTLMHLLEDAENEKEEDKDTKECKGLFKNVKFFLSREVPRESLLFVIPAFGGIVSWGGNGAPFNEDDQSITHQIVDRPIQGHRYLSREYVQPQWVYDCVNARIILPTDGYLLGRIPPPHLSPFVDNEAEGYIPEYAETIKRLQAAARNDVLPMPGSGIEDLDDPQNLLLEGYISRKEANEAAERERKKEVDQKQYLEELKMEIEKYKPSSASKKIKQVSDDTDAMEESGVDLEKQKNEDIENMSTLTLPRKKRGLLRAMQISKERKQEHVNKLKERRRQLKAQASGN